MKNITITLPDALAHRAKVFAAERNTSVSQYVGSLLADRIKAEDQYEQARQTWMATQPAVINREGHRYPSREELYDRASLR